MAEKQVERVNSFERLHSPEDAEEKVRREATNFDLELHFTDVYRRYQDAHVAVREAMCLRVLFPALCEPIRMGDRLVGRVSYRQVGFGLERASGGPGYYCHTEGLRRELDDALIDDETRVRVEEMIAFWQKEATIDGRLNAILPPDIKTATTNDIATMEGRLAGALPDFARLVRLGLPGLREEVEQQQARALWRHGDMHLYAALLMILDLLADVCGYYARQARDMVRAAEDNPAWQAELGHIADNLEHIMVAKPANLREGTQLLWLYALVSGVVNYGRMDVALGDLYAQDLKSGALIETEALALLQSLWQLIADRKTPFNGRITLGGLGRPNTSNADRFALTALEATRTVLASAPQCTLRFYQGQNPALMHKALDVLSEGRTCPMLYNDDVNIPAVQRAFDVSREEALQYLPYGCGEYALDHLSFGSPNCSLNLLKALEATLHNGRDGHTGELLGLALGTFRTFATFEELLAAYQRQVEYHIEYLAQRHALEYKAERESAAFLYLTLLYDDCLQRGKALVDGGARYLGGVIETFGMVNVADSLTAIRQYVYDEKRLTQDQLLMALDANFEGYEAERRLLLAAPKYGNDNTRADDLLCAISRHAAETARQQAAKVGLDYYLIVNIDNHANVRLGQLTAASADGRKLGAPLAKGNTPTVGMEKGGVTAFINSIVKPDPGLHAGYVHSLKFNKQLFTEERPKLEALLRNYFAKGGAQAMITALGQEDLETAPREPEGYSHLL